MTYIKLPHTDLDDERWMAAGSDAFALHYAAMVWCDRRLTDGRFPRAMATRVALPVAPDRVKPTVATLLEHGYWIEDGDTYVIVDYLEHAFTAEQIKRTRAKWSEDKARQRQHRVGDHALCSDTCKAVSAVDSTKESSGGFPRIDQTRQTRPDVESGSGKGGGSALPADAERSADVDEAPSDPYPTAVGDCPHMPGGLDQHVAFPDRIRCKECRNAEKARARADALAAARAELEATRGEAGATS